MDFIKVSGPPPIDYNAFSHGQIQSKIWLCEEIENFINKDSRVAILGSWYNILGFMMLVRKPKYYISIRGFDKDHIAVELANKMTEAWSIQPDCYLQNEHADVNRVDLNGYDVIINTSVEHMESQEWFHKAPGNALICIQSSNVVVSDENWDIKNPSANFKDFIDMFPLNTYMYKGHISFDYGPNSYSRFMIIGYK